MLLGSILGIGHPFHSIHRQLSLLFNPSVVQYNHAPDLYRAAGHVLKVLGFYERHLASPFSDLCTGEQV